MAWGNSLPPKRKRPRSGIQRAPRRVWTCHERFVRTHQCCVEGCWAEPVVFCHWSTAANSGKALKSFSWFGISLCDAHHTYAHQHGHKTFEREFKVNWLVEAAKFVKASPDIAMKEAMREPGAVLNPEDDLEWMEAA